MIINSLFKILFAFVEWIFDFIPDIDMSAILEADFEPVFKYIKFITYFFPMQTVLLIIELNLALLFFKIIISSLKTIWGILPLI